MAQTIAVANMKGGVGKTTLSAMLAESLAHGGARVLLIDLDAQGSLSFALMGTARFEETVRTQRTISTYFGERRAPNARGLDNFITQSASLLPTCSSLDLIAAEPNLQSVERGFIGDISRFGMGDPFKHPEDAAASWIKRELRALSKRYQYIIFDCPPGISIFAFAGIQNSATVIVPATPDYLSMLAVTSMHDHALKKAVRGRRNAAPIAVKIILNRCPGGATGPGIYRQKILDYISKEGWSAKLAAMQIPQKTKLQRAMEAGEDRKWNKFADKYDESDTQQLLHEMVGWR